MSPMIFNAFKYFFFFEICKVIYVQQQQRLLTSGNALSSTGGFVLGKLDSH